MLYEVITRRRADRGESALFGCASRGAGARRQVVVDPGAD